MIMPSLNDFQSRKVVLDPNLFPESPQQIFFDISLARHGLLALPKPIMSKRKEIATTQPLGPGTSITQELNKIKVLLMRLAVGR